MFSAWSRSRSWATSVKAARRASSARLESSRSVQTPNQRMIAPSGPRMGMLRALNQRYSPSARRKRHSASNGLSVLRDSSHNASVRSRSIGWRAEVQP